VARRHAVHYRDFLERIEAEWEVRSTAELQASYAWRRDNLRAALEWSFSDRGDASIAVALTVAAVPFWRQLASLGEWRQRIDQAIARLPEGNIGDARFEMKLYAALAGSLSSFRRAAAPLERVLQLARQIGDVEQQLRSLYMLSVARRDGTLELAHQFSAIAPTPADKIVADLMYGVSYHVRGSHSDSRRHLERMVAGSSALRASSSIVRFRTNKEMSGPAYLARVLWIQGHPQQAMQLISRTVMKALAADHALSTCEVLGIAACPIALWAEDLVASQYFADLSKDIAPRYGMRVFTDWNRCHLGILDVLHGRVVEGIGQMRAGLNALRADDRGFWMLDTILELASALVRAGRLDEAAVVIADVADDMDRTDEKWIRPELLRVQGELLRQKEASAPSDRADGHFHAALEDAQRQGALFWELRAASSLAKSLRDQGRRAEAAGALRPIYERFTEGRQMPLLRSARALLDTL
jgi:hypothetical protein